MGEAFFLSFFNLIENLSFGLFSENVIVPKSHSFLWIAATYFSSITLLDKKQNSTVLITKTV